MELERIATAFLGLVLTMTTAACSGDSATPIPTSGSPQGSPATSVPATPSPTPTPTPTPTPAELLQRSAQQMTGIRWVAFSLTHEAGSASIGSLGLDLHSVEGSVAMPGRFKLQVEATPRNQTAFVKLGIVVVADKAYMQLLGRWGQTNLASLPLDFNDLGRTLGAIMLAIEGPAFSGAERVAGVPIQRIKGTVDSATLRTLLPQASPGFQVEIEVWISQEDHLVRKARVKGPILSGDIPGVSRLLTLRDFDVPVTIEPPVP